MVDGLLIGLIVILVVFGIVMNIWDKKYFTAGWLLVAEAVVWFTQHAGFWERFFIFIAIVGAYIVCDRLDVYFNLLREMKETQRELDELNEEPV